MNSSDLSIESMSTTTPKATATTGGAGPASLLGQLSQLIFTVASEAVRSAAVKSTQSGGPIAKLVDQAAQRSAQENSTSALATVNDAAAQMAAAAVLAMKTVVDNNAQTSVVRAGSPASMAKHAAQQMISVGNDAIRKASVSASQAASKNPGGAMLSSAIKQVAEKMISATTEAAYAAASAAASAVSLHG